MLRTLDIQVDRVALRFVGQDFFCAELFACDAVCGRDLIVFNARLLREQSGHRDGRLGFLRVLLWLWRLIGDPLVRRSGVARCC
jgi:hypothetical protein